MIRLSLRGRCFPHLNLFFFVTRSLSVVAVSSHVTLHRARGKNVVSFRPFVSSVFQSHCLHSFRSHGFRRVWSVQDELPHVSRIFIQARRRCASPWTAVSNSTVQHSIIHLVAKYLAQHLVTDLTTVLLRLLLVTLVKVACHVKPRLWAEGWGPLLPEDCEEFIAQAMEANAYDDLFAEHRGAVLKDGASESATEHASASEKDTFLPRKTWWSLSSCWRRTRRTTRRRSCRLLHHQLRATQFHQTHHQPQPRLQSVQTMWQS